MKTLICTVAAAAAMLATPALAQVYGSVGYSNYATDDDLVEANLGAVTGRIGTHFSPNFGGEIEGSFGVSDDTVDVLGTPVDFKVEHHLAVYVVGFVPLSDSVEIFGRLGLGTGEASGSAGGFTASDSGSGFEAGFGGQAFFGGGNHGLRADYTYSDTLSSHVFSIGYAFRFGGQ